MALEKLLERVNSDIESADRALEKFRQKLETDPAYALEWSLSSFEYAATRQVALQVKTWIENLQNQVEEKGYTEDHCYSLMKAEATKVAIQKATRMAQSTSPTSNLIEDFTRAAWAKSVDSIWGYFSQEKYG